MGPLAIGSVVLVDFPYSNYVTFKNRPALILGVADFGDYILCQITSRNYPSRSAVSLDDVDFENGSLQLESYIRPDKIYTADKIIIERKVGKISSQKIEQVKQKLVHLFMLNKPS